MAGIKEECGVFGIYDLDSNDVTSSIYYGLTSLQHRGQEACGLAVSDTKGAIGNVKFHKDLGTGKRSSSDDTVRKMRGISVSDMYDIPQQEHLLQRMHSLVLSYVKGTLALAHNGNLVNTPELKWN